MTVSVRAPYAWHCEQCGQERGAPVWRVIDARERADVLAAPVPGVPGVSWADCPVCGTRTHIEAPLLVLRPGAAAPLLLAVSVAELGGGPPPSGEPLLAEAARAGAFLGGVFPGEAIPLPRRLLPHVLARDLERDLADPESACRELEPEGAPTVANYRIFLEYLGEARADSLVGELLTAMLRGLPDTLAELVRTHPELTDGTRVRDAGREELRRAADTPLKEVLRMRQRLLDELCDGRTTPDTAMRRYFESLGRFDAGLRTRLHAMYLEARDTDGPEGIPLAREALELAAGLGEEGMETELAARLGERLVLAVHAGLDADPSEAVRVLERALSRLREGTLQWVEVANNLASAHHLRDDGDRSEIWEAARDLLARATALDRGEYPEYWARVQTNYGLLLSERPGGGPEDLTLGIEHIRAGLEERAPERDRVAWAYSMVNLGLLLYRRAAVDDLREAEQCYRDALSHLGAGDDPALWSRIQCNLGDLLLSRDPVDARGAREAATAALALSTARPGLLDTGRIAWLLARALDHLDGPGSADGLRLRHAALAATPATVSPSLHLNIARELLRAHASAERWSEAADVASGMLTAVTALYDAQVTGTGRRSVLAQVNRIARWAAFLLARAGRPERAVEAIEGGVACELSVVAGRGTADLEALERIDPAAAHRYRLAQARYRSSVGEASAAASGGPAVAGSTVSGEAAAERGVRAAIAEIRAIPGFERFLRTDGLADTVRAAGGRPLVYLVNAPWGSYALVLPRSPGESPAVRAVHIPGVSSETVTGLLVLDPADGAPGLLLAQEAGALRRRRLLPQALDRLAALGPLLRPVASLLAEDPEQEAVVVPTGLLGLVPLHAVPLGPGAGEVLDDIGTVILSPSAAVYASSRLAAARPPDPVPRLVAVTDPDGSLPGGRGELAQIRELFEPHGEARCAVGPEATVDWLLARLAEASYLHIICHGSGEFDGRGASLALADGRLDMDTLGAYRLPACRLAVASACQSGHYEVVRAPDEFRGLAAGFLQAGAACAVAGLWLVDDMVTAVLMARFYELLAPAQGPGGLPPVAALRRARTWLRRLTWEELARYTASRPHLAAQTERYTARATTGGRPFASPVHWAAFTAWGV
ncbi:CHAT domain-containing protein [Streptomyces sp. NPDC097981]|uniref:CHAT domain-containing protein n=1 Tax=Streptomyces sp. NPDC097981 TaxID=3155428 RepID=UPI003333828C